MLYYSSYLFILFLYSSYLFTYLFTSIIYHNSLNID